MKLGQRDDDDDEEEDRGLCLANTFPLGAGAAIERVVDVQSQHLAHVGGLAARQGNVLVKQLEAVGQGEERADGNAGHDHGKLDLEQDLPVVGTVDLGGFGAGLAVFMFTGFMKSVPIEIEEAAMIDGCNPLQIFFKVVFPILKPTMISTAILETMWVWNDYLLPTLVLDIKKYRTIPMAIQYFRGGYGRVELAPMMACIIIAIIPIIILYMTCQKYIIEGVVAGAVKG